MMCEHEFICPNCNGNGYLELHAMGPEKCNVCRGKGVIQSMPTNLIANLEKALLDDLYQQLAAVKHRLEAAEKVCDAVKMFYLQVPYQSNRNGIAMWGEIDNAIKQWQEVSQCADQQLKK